MAVIHYSCRTVCVGTKSKGQLPPLQGKPNAGNILNAILPPREWLQDEKHFIQYASSELATRVDVSRLRETLDARLLQRQAREKGICPVREDLFQQAFDEIIRQITLAEPERGLLLLRIRDECRNTIGAYQTLYHSSVNFAMKK